MDFEERLQTFETEVWSAGVIGLGYVGLPLLVAAWKSGLEAVGFDVSESLIDSLNSGKSHIDDVSSDELAEALAGGVTFTTDPERLREVDAIFICVPSPLGSNRQPDLTYVAKAAKTIESMVAPGQLVSLESTSYPGTTEDYILAAVQAAGLEIDKDVYVAFSPERVSPGDAPATKDIPKVVGGVTPRSGEIAEAAYKRLVSHVHSVSSARIAEMAKLMENIYRAVNIGLVNEMAQLANELDIDIWEVIDAAATKPFGFQPFYPGPGVGGHCIPLDPQYLAWRAREANFATRFIDVADQVNRDMPRYVTSRIGEVLNRRGLPVYGSKVLGVGVAYKANISDDRESASVEVLRELKKKGAIVSVLDPHVSPERIQGFGFEPCAAEGDLDEFDIAVVLTDHKVIDYQRIADRVPTVFDTRGIYRSRGIVSERVVPL